MIIVTALIQLWNDWEIRVLVLLSFTLQVFLFFCGGLRRRNTSKFVSLLLWLAYLEADSIAVYVLGLLSRNTGGASTSGGTSELAFLWAPFLLIHLGGQDTITAFSMEDNELWLRHLLNLLVQISLVMYAFWKSTARVGRLLVPAIFVFIAGISKYGERIWALKRASWKALRSSTGNQYDEPSRQMPAIDTYVQALQSSRYVRALFTGLKVVQMTFMIRERVRETGEFLRFMEEHKKTIEIAIGLMYDELYTKMAVIRTWPGVILRCVAQISTTVAFVLFLISNKEEYSTADIVITYVLFGGGFFLEVSAIFMLLLSPWTWDLLDARKCRLLGSAAWSVFALCQPETWSWWSNSMGQYDLVSSSLPDPIGKIMGLAGAEELWRNFRHTKHIQVPPKAGELIIRTAKSLVRGVDMATDHHGRQNLQKLSDELLQRLLPLPFEELILSLHLTTGLCCHLDSKNSTDSTSDRLSMMATGMAMSNYMLYLLVVHPFMLPVGAVEALLANTLKEIKELNHASSKDAIYEALQKETRHPASFHYPLSAFLQMVQNVHSISTLLQGHFELPDRWEAIEEVWVRVLCYAASKSPAQGHVKRLSMGGELLTHVWVMLGLLRLGDCDKPLELVSLFRRRSRS